MTVRAWATELGCTRAWVYEMIKRTNRTCHRVGAQWLLTPEDREAILTRPRRRRGRPRKVIDTV
jgi:hypothetical protein